MRSRTFGFVLLLACLGACSPAADQGNPTATGGAHEATAKSKPKTPHPSSTTPKTLTQAREAVAPAVARLLVTRWETGKYDPNSDDFYDECAEYTGTGFFVRPRILITAAHVVEGRDRVRVTNGTFTAPAKVIGYSEEKDVAAVQVEAGVFDTLAFTAKPVKVGEVVGTYGYSAGRGLSFDRGDVNRVGVKVQVEDHFRTQLIEVNFSATHGNSGAPVFDRTGHVVGLHIAGIESGAGQRLVVPASVAKPLVDNWLQDPPDTSTGSTSCPVFAGNTLPTGTLPETELDPNLQDAWLTYQQYVLGINDGDFPTAFAQLATKGLSFQKFQDGVATSKISDVTIMRFRGGDRGPILDVDFSTHQDAGQGPAPRPDETCTAWHLRYSFVRSHEVWLIGSARAIPGQELNEACDAVD